MRAHRLMGAFTAVAVGVALAGCGEKPQTASGIKSDQPPYTGGSPFAERGWTAGDKTAWAQHLRARAQYGQNEYSRPASAAQ